MKKNILIFFLSTGLFAQDAFDIPTIKETMEKATFWQLANPKHKAYDWTNGAFYAGVFAAYETTQNDIILDSIIAMGNRIDWRPGTRLVNADDHAICQTYIDIASVLKERGEEIDAIMAPTRVFLRDFKDHPYVGYKRRHLTTWWWCDALFMAPPALVKYGNFTGNSVYLKLNDSLFKETVALLWDEDEHLFARDIDYLITDSTNKREANGKKIFWSRGNGWVMGGLVRVLDELPVDYPERDMYVDLYLKMSQKIVDIQQKDGLWRASLLDPESYPGGETSGSGFYCYALAWGLNNGLLKDKKYEKAVKKAWSSLFDVVQEDGKVGWVQPIGHDPRRNFSKDSWEVYGTGAFLLAGSEIVKLLD